ncbi:hypothetical protein AMATHDRAFT_152548 [Amanita thiersii Skay4041]|uniref:intramembrane prenyl-peptidase Rce1 n=1 Tax=Amanita thiersii Skay4041 TaxID=703135 RepID=A0A2A9ND78_9AGAR|nr:hypothetical protein AMATHDRAFT_152548 [Amanita thiersii Skay4041]
MSLPPPPPLVEQLTTTQAHVLALAFASAYVGSLYMSRHTRLSFAKGSSGSEQQQQPQVRMKERHERWRDDDEVIRARLTVCACVTVGCCAAVLGVQWCHGSPSTRLLGLHTLSLRVPSSLSTLSEALTPHLLTPLLFAGPLYTTFLDRALPFMTFWSIQHDIVDKFTSWQGLRNYILGPITEELVFRSCILAVTYMAGTGRKSMIFLTPLYFGLAHVHRAWETFNMLGRTRTAAKQSILMSTFQFAYTTLFGSYCAYLFLRTGTVLPPITAHAFCNVMGLPQVGYEMRRFSEKRWWILLAYIFGIIGFVNRLEPWTRTRGSLFWT